MINSRSSENEISSSPEEILLSTLASYRSDAKVENEEKILEIVKQATEEIHKKEGDINCRDSLGRTAVWIAVVRNFPQTLRLLIEAKADYHREPKSNLLLGVPYITKAAQYRSSECVNVLIEKFDSIGLKKKRLEETEAWDGDTSLGIAAENGDIRTLKVLLEAKADVNTKNSKKNSPLYNATRGYFIHHRSNNYLQCIQKLIEVGALPITPEIKPLDYKMANIKTTKLIFSKLKEASPIFFDWDSSKLYKSLASSEISDGIRKAGKKFSFELVVIISEYLGSAFLENSSLFSSNARIYRLKNQAILSCFFALAVGIGFFAGAKIAQVSNLLSSVCISPKIEHRFHF